MSLFPASFSLVPLPLVLAVAKAVVKQKKEIPLYDIHDSKMFLGYEECQVLKN